MPLTLPALFVYIEVKDYIPAAFAGARLSHWKKKKSSAAAERVFSRVTIRDMRSASIVILLFFFNTHTV